jgi:hypothetical protein
MGRSLGITAGGLVFQVLNRGIARMPVFEEPDDYAAFERIREEGGWQWSGLWRLVHGDDSSRPLAAAWPVARPKDGRSRVNRPQSAKGLEALRRCTNRGQPYCSPAWVDRMVKRSGPESFLRPRGRLERTPHGS